MTNFHCMHLTILAAVYDGLNINHNTYVGASAIAERAIALAAETGVVDYQEIVKQIQTKYNDAAKTENWRGLAMNQFTVLPELDESFNPYIRFPCVLDNNEFGGHTVAQVSESEVCIRILRETKLDVITDYDPFTRTAVFHMRVGRRGDLELVITRFCRDDVKKAIAAILAKIHPMLFTIGSGDIIYPAGDVINTSFLRMQTTMSVVGKMLLSSVSEQDDMVSKLMHDCQKPKEVSVQPVFQQTSELPIIGLHRR